MSKSFHIRPKTNQDTIFCKADGWYWTDEVEDEYGPCSSEEEARKKQMLYCDIFLGGTKQTKNEKPLSKTTYTPLCSD